MNGGQTRRLVPHVGKLIHLQKQTQVLMKQLEAANLTENMSQCALSQFLVSLSSVYHT